MALLRPDRITNRSISPSPFSQRTDPTPSKRVPGQSPGRVVGNSQQTPRPTGTVARLLEQQAQLKKSTERIEKALEDLRQAAETGPAASEGRTARLPKELSVRYNK